MHAEHENRRSQLEDARQRADAVDLQLGTIKAEFETNMTTLLAREADLVQARKEADDLQGMVLQVREELDLVKDKLEEEQVVSEAFRAGEERLDQVAGGLRSVATESVKDVGGLFAKLGASSIQKSNDADFA
jgi:kinesin family protein 11